VLVKKCLKPQSLLLSKLIVIAGYLAISHRQEEVRTTANFNIRFDHMFYDRIYGTSNERKLYF
jgi:hypothetical protein